MIKLARVPEEEQEEEEEEAVGLLIVREEENRRQKKRSEPRPEIIPRRNTSDFSGALFLEVECTSYCFSSTIGKWFFHGESFALFHGPRSFWPINSLRGNVPLAETSVCRDWALRADSRQQQLFRMKSRKKSLTMLLRLFST